MDFRTAIMENAGRDIYVGMEYPSGNRQEYICKRYRVMGSSQGLNQVVLCPGDSRLPALEICLEASLKRYRPRLLLVDIEAEWGEMQYHIYIGDDINRDIEKRFRQQTGQNSIPE
ncbi:MAG: hypothetical protein J1F02_12100 [Lachnospiraceae bacterium]|nr:hypothetical protein [Lachnospiraceae bacterium]